MSKKVISVLCINGYVKHQLHERVSELMGEDTREYEYNSEGAVMHFITDQPIPESTSEYDVWTGIWDMDLLDDIIERMEQGTTEYLPTPTEFVVDGQTYRFIGELWGYSSYSTSPDDERYEP